MDAEHVVRFVGLAVLPYATCVPFTPPSVAQVVVSVTLVVFVELAVLFMVKLHHAGAVAS